MTPARHQAPGNAPVKPRIGFLLGDPNGIGPELAAKLLARPQNADLADIVVFTDESMLASGCRSSGVSSSVVRARHVDVRHVDLIKHDEITPGQATPAGGRAALVSLKLAAAAAGDGEIDAIVFAPLNKHAMRLAGLVQEDELRLLQELFSVQGFVSEFNITEGLWTSRVTSHIPLSEVAANITQPRVLEAIHIVHRYLVASGMKAPRIAVAGLNPHAGDGGSLGREEIDVIAPAIAAARAQGIAAAGPLSPDTMFVAARRGDYDAVVCMYHDQGQIAMKLLGFEQGVTLHGGLPIPVATCASGTAFDIVGRNMANVQGLQAAFTLAATIAAANIASAAAVRRRAQVA
ncbi:MAG: 4-hydroxythreonine-4-phosphate dehydrogenase PdxA [Pseudomonadota bacterium]|nr:4-hydroxythreonine-4-phosphate dehydrogenase PdxA [Pseudomonadota bacterium]